MSKPTVWWAVCYKSGRGKRWWPATWTTSTTRRDAIAAYDKSDSFSNYERDSATGRVKVMRVEVRVLEADRGAR